MSPEPVILVIDGGEARAQDLKASIEFMDAPRVSVVGPNDWRARLGNRRLAAIFVGDDLDQDALDRVIREVGEFDPNTPIVRVRGRDPGATTD